LKKKIKFGKISVSVGFIKKKFVTMHGHMNVEFYSIYILTASLNKTDTNSCILVLTTRCI